MFQHLLSPIGFEHSGIIYLSLACLFGGFGNSLEPVSILALCQSCMLLLGFHAVARYHHKSQTINQIDISSPILSKNIIIAIILSTIYMALAMVIGFMSVFGYPHTTFLSVAATFLLGLGMGLLMSILALLPQYYYTTKLPRYPLTPCVFAAGLCVVSHTIVGRTFSTFPSLANALLDYSPLRQLASLFGIISIDYLVAFVCTLSYHCIIFDNEIALMYHIPGCMQPNALALKKTKSYISYTSSFCFILFVITGFLSVSDRFYQKNVSELTSSYSTMSCMFAQDVRNGSQAYDQLWQYTEQRLAAGDAIVLWSEENVDIFSDEEEEELLAQASYLTKLYGTGYLGITFKKITSTMTTNQFALITADGSIAWNYHKAHPVMFVESDVTAGPAILPTYDAPSGILQGHRLGGAICFDLDFPSFLIQASWKQVDLLLQPSWTWNALDVKHFDGNAMRAVENGFTLFRCSSDGQSGVVSSSGVFLSRRISLDQPSDGPMIFEVPIAQGQITFYGVCGFIVEYLLIILLAILILQMILVEIVLCYSGSFTVGSSMISVSGWRRYMIEYVDWLVRKYGPETHREGMMRRLVNESTAINQFHTFHFSSTSEHHNTGLETEENRFDESPS